MDDLKIEELDLYEILDVPHVSTTAEIKKAYRRKALKCHPDKNPGNPNAAQEFHKLSKILEILIDESARQAYDKVLNARKEAALRHKALDSKRRKLKEDLEEREKRALAKKKDPSATLKQEIERLRKEGSRQVEEEIEKIQREVTEQLSQRKDKDGSLYRIKLKWNGKFYTQEMLHRFLSKYGNISALVLSTKRKGTGLVEFESRNAAEMAIDMEKGLAENPLSLEWVNPPPPTTRAPSSLTKSSDFESLTLTRLRQAEERKKLIEQLKAEDSA